MNLEYVEAQILLANLKNMPVKIVAIDGHGGAGKSTLALTLAKELGAEIIHTDDFASPDNQFDWWKRLKKEVLEQIKNGATTVSYEKSLWDGKGSTEMVKHQTVTPVMIIEGVSSLRKEFRDYIAYGIWVEASKDVCIERGVKRDGEAMRGQWEKWWAGEEAYIQRDNPIAFANTIVNTTEPDTI